MTKPLKPKLHKGVSGSAITVRVISSAPKNHIIKILSDGTIQVDLAAKSCAGSGNKILLDYLAKVLDISAMQLELVAGAEGADKLIAITDLDTATVHQRVMEKLKTG